MDLATSCASGDVSEGIERAVTRSDWLRTAPREIVRPQAHKEWLHFCVYGRDLDVLVNFSLLDDVRTGSAYRERYARLTMLVRHGRWRGEVRRFAASEVEAHGGGLELRFGECWMRFAGGRYLVGAAFADGSVAVDLELTPMTMPSIVNNVRVGDGAPINWLVVPRLCASGTICIDGEIHDVAGAAAYHDHNWGFFGWGRDFAWEWGYGLPSEASNPWSLVFVRLSNRGHTRAMMQGVFLWKEHREQRVFRDADLHIEHAGLRRATSICKVPGVMALIHPETATDIPARLLFAATAEGDWLEGEFFCGDVAQVIIPNDRGLGVTVINEVSGRLAVQAQVRGERLSIDGRAVFEFLGA